MKIGITIGAGRVVKQALLRIGDAIADGEIEKAPALRGLIEQLRQTKKDVISWGCCHRAACIRIRITQRRSPVF